jgi:chromosome segregation ATPase
MSEAAVKLLEARIGEAVERLRDLAAQRRALEAERSRLLDEVDTLQRELASSRDDGRRRDVELRSALADALAALGEE